MEAVLPAPKGYSHEHKPLSAILLPLVFSLCRLREGKFFFVKRGLVNMAFVSCGVCLFGRFDNSLCRYYVFQLLSWALYDERLQTHPCKGIGFKYLFLDYNLLIRFQNSCDYTRPPQLSNTFRNLHYVLKNKFGYLVDFIIFCLECLIIYLIFSELCQ